MKYIILFLFFALISCKKEQSQVVQQPVEPVMLKIEAVDKDGKAKESPVILVR